MHSPPTWLIGWSTPAKTGISLIYKLSEGTVRSRRFAMPAEEGDLHVLRILQRCKGTHTMHQCSSEGRGGGFRMLRLL